MFEENETADETQEAQTLNQISAEIKTHENWSGIEEENIKEFVEVIGPNPFGRFVEITAVGGKVIELYEVSGEWKATAWVRTCGIRGRATLEDYEKATPHVQTFEEKPDIVKIAEEE